MSTEIARLVDEDNPNYYMAFESSMNGYKFMFCEEGSDEVLKIWFNKESWEEFKMTVDRCLSK